MTSHGVERQTALTYVHFVPTHMTPRYLVSGVSAGRDNSVTHMPIVGETTQQVLPAANQQQL